MVDETSEADFSSTSVLSIPMPLSTPTTRPSTVAPTSEPRRSLTSIFGASNGTSAAQAIQDDQIGGNMVFSDATEVNCWAVRRMPPTNWESCEARRLSLHPPAVL